MVLLPDQLNRALSDVTRLRIMMLLAEAKEVCVCDLTMSLELDQPKISRHLAVLRKAGLVQDRKVGQWVHYRIHAELPRWASEVLQALLLGCNGKQPYQGDRQRLAASRQCC